MKVLPTPLALPGKCALCGSSDNDDGREYIDIGFELDFYGVIYFCTHCFGEIAYAIGFAKPLIARLENENKKFLEEIAGLSAENVKLRVSLNSLDFLGSHGTFDDFDPGVKESVVTEGPDNSKPSKSTDESRSANVPKTGKSKSAKSSAEFDELDLQ